jgi:hypothetical protein
MQEALEMIEKSAGIDSKHSRILLQSPFDLLAKTMRGDTQRDVRLEGLGLFTVTASTKKRLELLKQRKD